MHRKDPEIACKAEVWQKMMQFTLKEESQYSYMNGDSSKSPFNVGGTPGTTRLEAEVLVIAVSLLQWRSIRLWWRTKRGMLRLCQLRGKK